MRVIPQDTMDAITYDREISGRLIARDVRLRFTEIPYAAFDHEIALNLNSYDADTYNNGILRVVNAGSTLKYCYVTDPASPPVWKSSGIALKANSKPGVHKNRIFYQASNGSVYYTDFNGTSLGTPVNLNLTEWHSSYVAAIAPVAPDFIYMFFKYANGTAEIVFFDLQDREIRAWHGMVWDAPEIARSFDAERLDGRDYVFFTDREGKRTQQVSCTKIRETGYTFWMADARQVVPLDIVDDTSFFQVSAVTMINGRMMLTGVLSRTGAGRMHIYSFGPDHYTMGRDMYIGEKGTNEFIEHVVVGGLDEDVTFPFVNGYKMHMLGSQLVYLGPGVCYTAPATMLVGYDNPALKTVYEGVYSIRLDCDSNASSRLVADLSTQQRGIEPGMQVTLEASINGKTSQMGVFDVDGVVYGQEENGQVQHVVARGAATKRMTQWAADADYDYWSQGKQSCDPSTLTELVRVSGHFKDGSPLTPSQMNDPCLLYTTVRASRGQHVRGLFNWTEAGDCKPSFGFILNYHRKPKASNQKEMGDNGIGVLYSREASGFRIYYVEDSVWTWSSQRAYFVPEASTPYWIAFDYHNGLLSGYYRKTTETAWKSMGGYATQLNDRGKKDLGRTALYLENVTPHSTCYGFTSSSDVIPVYDPTQFKAGDIVQVDDELIEIEGTIPTPDHPIFGTWIVINGEEYEGAPHPNEYYKGPFEGYPIWCDYMTSQPYHHDALDGLSLVVTGGPGAGTSFKIVDFDYHAPNKWVSTIQNPRDGERWTDTIGDIRYGYWMESRACRFFVDRSPSGIIGPGSRVMVVSSLKVKTRGYNNTTATSHSGTDMVASVYTEPMVSCEQYEHFTIDEDISFEDLATEIARKAGVLYVRAEKLMEGDYVITHSGWKLNSDIQNAHQRGSTVIRFKIKSGAEAGIAFRHSTIKTLGTFWSTLLFTSTHIKYGNFHFSIPDGTAPTILEEVPHHTYSIYKDWITVSIYKQYVSIWHENRHIWTFVDPNLAGGGVKVAFVSNGPATFEVDWPELDMRVDNFILDSGKNAIQLLDRLIGEKHIYYQDDQYGGLRLYRNRTLINENSPCEMIAACGDTFEDTTIATRMRLEGAEVVEVIDFDAMQRYGNIFRVENSSELEELHDFVREAEYRLQEGLLNSRRLTLTGPANPLVEPGDILRVKLPDGTKDVIVDRVGYDMKIDQEGAVFDMEIDARDASFT